MLLVLSLNINKYFALSRAASRPRTDVDTEKAKLLRIFSMRSREVRRPDITGPARRRLTADTPRNDYPVARLVVPWPEPEPASCSRSLGNGNTSATAISQVPLKITPSSIEKIGARTEP